VDAMSTGYTMGKQSKEEPHLVGAHHALERVVGENQRAALQHVDGAARRRRHLLVQADHRRRPPVQVVGAQPRAAL
jgi:hypothetical protein